MLLPRGRQQFSRLELTAAKVAVPANRILLNEIDILVDHVAYWTDSMDAFRYFQNSTARFHTFLANRLVVIHDVSQTGEWRYMYINRKLNTADHASRDLSADSLVIKRNGAKHQTFNLNQRNSCLKI